MTDPGIDLRTLNGNIYTLGDKAGNVKPTVVHIEGDPDSPVNRGALCPKGVTLRQFVVNDRRLTYPQYRAPCASEWKAISWEEAITRIARLIKDTRDAGFQQKDGKDVWSIVSRTRRSSAVVRIRMR